MNCQKNLQATGGTSYSSNHNLLVTEPDVLLNPLKIPKLLLMGAGPTNSSSRVLAACTHQLGPCHQETLKVMEEVKAGLQYIFQTKNQWTFVVSGPAHAGMESIMVNLLQPGETALIGVKGVWGERCLLIAKRIGANAIALEAEMGKSIPFEQIREKVIKYKPKVLFIVHSESSTGVMQSLTGVGDLCRENNCLLVVDGVASIGAVPFFMDEWQIDAVYSGAQKAIGALPGLAPVSLGPRAMEKINCRRTEVRSFIFDLKLLGNWWRCDDDLSAPRCFHHTVPVNLLFSLREALAEIVDEGLPNVWKRYEEAHGKLEKGIEEMGLEFNVRNPKDRLPTVTSVQIPEGVDQKLVSQYAHDKYHVEIAGGFGASMGKAFRLGLLGKNATTENVDLILKVFKESLQFAKSQKAENLAN